MAPYRSLCLASLIVLGFLTLPPWLSAATFSCASGDVPCLVSSIAKANASGVRNTIRLTAGDYILMTLDNTPLNDGGNGLPIITGQLVIEGEDASQTHILRDPDAPFLRLLHIAPTGQVILRRLTLAGGEVDANLGHTGGNIKNEGSLRLVESSIERGSASIGGCLYNVGVFEGIRSAALGCFADQVGGAMALVRDGGRPILLQDFFFAENMAASDGDLSVDPRAEVLNVGGTSIEPVATLNRGAHLGGRGKVTMIRTAVVGGLAGVRGGCVNWEGGELNVLQSSFTANGAVAFGGCFFVEDGEVSIDRTTITHNQAGLLGIAGTGGGILNAGGRVVMGRSLLTQNEADQGPDCFGTIEAERSLIGDPSGCTVTRARD